MTLTTLTDFRPRNCLAKLAARCYWGSMRRSVAQAGAMTVAISWASTAPSFSQPAYIPTPGALSPGYNHGTVNYSLQQEVGCPTATFNVTGFGGGISGWANNNYEPFQAADSGLGNYGISAGLSVPLGNTALRDFCRKYARIKGKFEEARLKNELLNGQRNLLEQCLYLKDAVGINDALDDKKPRLKEERAKAFSESGPLSAMAGCESLAVLLERVNRSPTEKPPSPPPKASTEPMTEPAKSVFVINQPR